MDKGRGRMAVEVAYLHTGLGDFWVRRRPLLMLPWSWKMNSIWLHTVSSFQRPDPSSGIFLTRITTIIHSSIQVPLFQWWQFSLDGKGSILWFLLWLYTAPSVFKTIEGIQIIALYGTYSCVSLWQSLCIFNHTFGRLPNWSLVEDTPCYFSW